MSYTPRTDAWEYDSQPGNPMFPNGKWVVATEKCRQLERELAEAKAEIERLEEQAEDLREMAAGRDI